MCIRDSAGAVRYRGVRSARRPKAEQALGRRCGHRSGCGVRDRRGGAESPSRARLGFAVYLRDNIDLSMTVPMNDLLRGFNSPREALLAALVTVAQSSWSDHGP